MKSDVMIDKEVGLLLAVKEVVPLLSMFGDNNHAAIDAQVEVLRERKTEDEVASEFSGFPQDAAMYAWGWMFGMLDGDNTPPSEDWRSTYE